MSSAAKPRLYIIDPSLPEGCRAHQLLKDHVSVGAANMNPKYDIELPQYPFEKPLTTIAPLLVVCKRRTLRFDGQNNGYRLLVTVNGIPANKQIQNSGYRLNHRDVIEIHSDEHGIGPYMFEYVGPSETSEPITEKALPLTALPDLILRRVFHFLDYDHLLKSVTRVCHRLHEVVHEGLPGPEQRLDLNLRIPHAVGHVLKRVLPPVRALFVDAPYLVTTSKKDVKLFEVLDGVMKDYGRGLKELSVGSDGFPWREKGVTEAVMRALKNSPGLTKLVMKGMKSWDLKTQPVLASCKTVVLYVDPACAWRPLRGPLFAEKFPSVTTLSLNTAMAIDWRDVPSEWFLQIEHLRIRMTMCHLTERDYAQLIPVDRMLNLKTVNLIDASVVDNVVESGDPIGSMFFHISAPSVGFILRKMHNLEKVEELRIAFGDDREPVFGYLMNDLTLLFHNWKSCLQILVLRCAYGGFAVPEIPPSLFKLRLLSVRKCCFHGNLPRIFESMPQLKCLIIEDSIVWSEGPVWRESVRTAAKARLDCLIVKPEAEVGAGFMESFPGKKEDWLPHSEFDMLEDLSK